jgi:glycosyltransferase involved in cell wall biosynthesis
MMIEQQVIEQPPRSEANPPANERLRIVQIVWWGELGGIALQLGDLVRQFRGSGHTLEVCVVHRSGPLLDALSTQDVTLTEIGARSGLDIFALLRLCLFLRSKKFDIVHVHTGSLLVSLAILLATGSARTVFQEHDPIRMGPGRAKRLLLYKLFGRAYDRFVAVSGDTAEAMIGAGVPSVGMVTIPNPVDAVAFSPRVSRERAKAHFGISQSVPTIGTACRFAHEKDLPLFLETAAIVAAARRDVVFIMVGTGDEHTYLQQRVKELQLSRSVLFAGLRTDMPIVWRAFDVYLFTSCLEAFGRTLLESLACETPVVAAVPLEGGAIELVRRSPGILPVEDRNPRRLAALVLRLLDSPGERQELGRLGRQWAAENYNVIRWAQRIDALYTSLHHSKKVTRLSSAQ